MRSRYGLSVDAQELLGDESERDARISDIFYFFEKLTSLQSGRTVGRKIGVVQETLVRKYLEQSEEIKRRMYLEQFLLGRSGASHKVEFSFHPIVSHTGLRVGDEIPGTGGVRIVGATDASEKLHVALPSGKTDSVSVAGGPKAKNSALRLHLEALDLDLRYVREDLDGILIDVVDRSQLLASIESKRVGAQRFSGSSKLGAGIQTIEKAKQASLVAIDLDLQHNGSVKPLESGLERKKLLSIVVLGNGVHWTEKDRAVLGTYVDFTWLVKDSAIIRYAEYVREMAGEEDDFLGYFSDYFVGMTKQPNDDFEVFDSDFTVITPSEERRTLREALLEHIVAVD